MCLKLLTWSLAKISMSLDGIDQCSLKPGTLHIYKDLVLSATLCVLWKGDFQIITHGDGWKTLSRYIYTDGV